MEHDLNPLLELSLRPACFFENFQGPMQLVHWSLGAHATMHLRNNCLDLFLNSLQNHEGINWSGFNFSKLSLTHLVLTSYPFWHETCLVKSRQPSQFHPFNCPPTLLSFPNLWDVVHPFGLGWTYHHLWCSVQTSKHSLWISWIGTGSRLVVVSWCFVSKFPRRHPWLGDLWCRLWRRKGPGANKMIQATFVDMPMAQGFHQTIH